MEEEAASAAAASGGGSGGAVGAAAGLYGSERRVEETEQLHYNISATTTPPPRAHVVRLTCIQPATESRCIGDERQHSDCLKYPDYPSCRAISSYLLFIVVDF